MSKYQNTALKPGNSEFVEVENYTGATAAFTARTTRVQVSTQSVDVTSGKLVYVLPMPIFACGDTEKECRLGVVNTVFRLEFNAIDRTNLQAIRAEANRLFDEAEAGLVRGVVPGAAATFADDE